MPPSMDTTDFSLLSLLSLLLLLSLLPPSLSHLHKHRLSTSETLSHAPTSLSPTTYFEVTRPISLPNSKPCSLLLLQHDFAFTYTKPPVTAQYTPPSCLSKSNRPIRIVFEWTATCQGRQFDRIFGVWLGGVELLRSCTAEPRATGIVWSVQKDVTKYSSLFFESSTLAVYLGNLVDSTYTGIYHVNVSLHFYFESNRRHGHHNRLDSFNSPADLILPISRNLPLNDGLWFVIQNSTDIQSKQLVIPSNTYRAILEVYVSFHSSDEFWYSNPPNAYLSANNLTDSPGNGAFREVTVRLDRDIVGAIWPFTVIYTGGINPLLWRPITGIGSFDLPSYNIEITPFLGKILNGKSHEFGFGVTDALDYWYIDANLHIWLDHKSSQTTGNLIKYEAPQFVPTLISNFHELDGEFRTSADRRISFTGWVKSSYGKITTHFSQELHYQNLMEFSGNGSIQLVNQTIQSSHSTYIKNPYTVLYTEQINQTFPLYLYTGTADQVNDSYSLISNVSLGFNEKKITGERLGFGISLLRNVQNGEGDMKVKGNLVTSGVGSTQQVYKYESTDGCYYRNVSSSNYSILYDQLYEYCTKMGKKSKSGFFNRWIPRRTSLATSDYKRKRLGK